MMRSKGIIYISIALLLSACVKPFNPALDDNAVNKYVVQGMVGSIEGWQTVQVSRTSTISLAEYIPVSSCAISIVDDVGNSFELNEFEAGIYRVWMNESDLVSGRSYKVIITTPTGDILESEFDKMPQGPDEVGDVYFELASIQTDDPNRILYGIQFYTNFSASEEDGEYYRWQCTETYEYRSPYPLQFYYDGSVHEVSPPDSSKMVCYKTNGIEDIFTLATINLATKEYPAFPLNFVQNTSDRLEILYSLLVEQYAISMDAYNYYDKLRINLQQSGGLYTSQPLAVKGNLINTSDEENEVLGFFQASSIAQKRVFVEAPVEGLSLEYFGGCTVNALLFGFVEISPAEYPAYLFAADGSWTMSTMTKNCVDCTLAGGITIKPDYWPN